MRALILDTVLLVAEVVALPESAVVIGGLRARARLVWDYEWARLLFNNTGTPHRKGNR